MKKLIVVSFFVSMTAFAHVEPGTYKGMISEGKECSMTAGETYFENEMHHPLNERIRITVGAQTFVVGHPPIISSKESVVSFNHDLFQGLLPTAKGAQAVEIEMQHSEDFEGPKSFTYIENSWREKVRESYKCENIKLVK